MKRETKMVCRDCAYLVYPHPYRKTTKAGYCLIAGNVKLNARSCDSFTSYESEHFRKIAGIELTPSQIEVLKALKLLEDSDEHIQKLKQLDLIRDMHDYPQWRFVPGHAYYITIWGNLKLAQAMREELKTKS